MTCEDILLFREFIHNLQNEDQRPAALVDIKNHLTFKPARVMLDSVKNKGISKIVECLNQKEKSHVDLTCEVLKLCFHAMEPGDFVKNYTSHAMFLLRHEKDCVRKLVVDEIYRATVVGPDVLPIPQYVDVFVAVAQLVADSDVGIANKAILVTSNLPFEAYAKVLEEMKIALEFNSSSKCNAYEVITNISVKSYDLLKLSADHGYFEHMLNELSTDDVLFQMNILELLSRLAITQHGIGYLLQNGALQKIAENIHDLKNNPLGNLLMPGYIKFFGGIAHHYPKAIFDKYPELIDSLFEAFETNEQSMLPVALDTLGFIGSTVEGKLCLMAVGSRFTSTVEQVGDLIRNSPTEIKTRALHCLSNLISVEQDPTVSKSGPVDHRVTLMTREWFRALSKTPPAMEVLFGICKNPFPDISLAAFSLLDAVCQHQWGEELVARTAGFVEYLLDRSMDYTKDTKEKKYDIVRRLSRSMAFEPNVLERMQTFVEQGPFYVETGLEVAIEEGD